MKKCLVGLLCLGMAVTATLGQVATLPISESYTAKQDWTALPGWTGVSIGSYADGRAQFDGNNDALTVNFDSSPGTLTFDLKGNTSTTGTAPTQFDVEESANGNSWSPIASIVEEQISTSYNTFGPYTLNSDSRFVRWTYVNKYAFNIGLNNVYITSGGPAVFTVVLDKENGFTVEQGTDAVIEAEALNGVAPIDYVWTTDMDPNEYGTFPGDGDGFWIKDNASTGTYYATVTATDSSSPAQTASNTVTFSVIPPAVKYQITINPSVNGTVTTTPAGEAAANTTVTVNATPAGGYAVDAITVNGGAVTVSGNTFVMPAAAVTVSVTFAESAMPDKLITFENGTLKTSYAPPVTVVLEDDMEWLADRVIKGNADNDKKIDILSARMGPLSGSNAVLQLTQPYAEPITRISYWVAGYGSDNMANVTLTVEVSTDGLQNWTPVETLTGAADITATMAEHVIETVPANAVYLRFVATSDAVTSRRVNLDNIGINLGEPIGVIKVNIAGNLSGTVNNQMSLEITLQNAIADDWWFTLKDPDNQDDYSYNWNAGTGEFLFTPSKVGNYTLTAEAVDAGDNPIANKTVTLAVSAATDVSIPPIVIVPGGFTFELPEGYTLANVYGADTVVEGDDFPWILLTSPTDYVVEGTTVTIKTDPAQRRLFRIFWQQ